MHSLSEHGHGVGAIANALNIRRKMNKEDIVSCSTVQRFIKQSPLTLKTRITTKKTGKTDIDSKWAKARLAQCKQYQIMLEAGTVRGIMRNGERIDNNVDESDSQDDYEDAEVNYDGEGKEY